MLGRLWTATKAYAVQEYIAGYLEEYFANATFESILRLARSGHGWDAISPGHKQRMTLMARQHKAALATITIDDVYRWLVDANPELAKQMFADREIISWLGKLWQEFVTMRVSVANS